MATIAWSPAETIDRLEARLRRRAACGRRRARALPVELADPRVLPPHPWEGAEWLLIPLATAVKGLPLLLFVVIAVRLAHERERRWLGQTLATELGADVLTDDELTILLSPPPAPASAAGDAGARGERAARLLRRLQREQVNLAMVARAWPRTRIPRWSGSARCAASLHDALDAIPGAASAIGSAGSGGSGRGGG